MGFIAERENDPILTKTQKRQILAATKLVKVVTGDFFEDDHVLCTNFVATILIKGKKVDFKLADYWCGDDVGDYFRAECPCPHGTEHKNKMLKKIQQSIKEQMEDEARDK